jgi:molybdopterin synthase sulfur carrier subunit
MQWKLFADLREVAGDSTVSVSVEHGDTVGDALRALFAARPALEERVTDDAGGLRDHINVLRNGEDVREDGGLDAPVSDDDELALFPPVSGG